RYIAEVARLRTTLVATEAFFEPLRQRRQIRHAELFQRLAVGENQVSDRPRGAVGGRRGAVKELVRLQIVRVTLQQRLRIRQRGGDDVVCGGHEGIITTKSRRAR